MRAVAKDLLAMKVTKLKKELEARGEGVTGNKAWLRWRLHAAIVREHRASRRRRGGHVVYCREREEAPEKNSRTLRRANLYTYTSLRESCAYAHLYTFTAEGPNLYATLTLCPVDVKLGS